MAPISSSTSKPPTKPTQLEIGQPSTPDIGSDTKPKRAVVHSGTAMATTTTRRPPPLKPAAPPGKTALTSSNGSKHIGPAPRPSAAATRKPGIVTTKTTTTTAKTTTRAPSRATPRADSLDELLHRVKSDDNLDELLHRVKSQLRADDSGLAKFLQQPTTTTRTATATSPSTTKATPQPTTTAAPLSEVIFS